MQQRQVRDLMRIRHGHVVPESTTLREVAERLVVSDCDVMAVTDSERRLSGIVGESSVVRALMANPDETTTIQSIVCRHAESVRLDASVSAVLPLFRSSAHTALPVIDASGCVCGLLLRRDIINSLLYRRVDTAESAPVANSGSVIRPPVSQQKQVKQKQTVIPHSAEPNDQDAGAAQRPHFLRAEEARRILWQGEDRL